MTVVPPVPDPTAPPAAPPAAPAPPAPPAPAPSPQSAAIAPPEPAPATPPAPPAAPAPPAPATADPDEGAKKALEAERTLRKNAERELDKLKKGPLSDAEKAIEDAKTEGRNEATATLNLRIIAAEIKAVAAGKLADPADAVLHLDASKFKVNDDGTIDGDIAAAIDELVKAKPYLAGGVTPKPGPVGGGPQGAGTPLTRDALKNMTAAQIAALDQKLVDAALSAP